MLPPQISVTPIADASDPRLAPYANLKDAQLRRAEWAGEHGVFICESELVVRALLESAWDVVSVLATPALLAKLAPALLAARAHKRFDVLGAPQELLQHVMGFGFHRGVMAAGLRKPQPSDCVDVLALLTARARAASCVLALEAISNHDNVGAVFRNVAALGGPAPLVVLDSQCCDPLYRKALRVSVGHVLRVPWIKLPPSMTTADCVALLQQQGLTVCALTPQSGATDITTLPGSRSPAFRPALVLGAEGPGLSDHTLAHAPLRLRIPMTPGVDSLNIATASAIAMSWLCTAPPLEPPS